MNDNQLKICPLLSISNSMSCAWCRGDCCAWWAPPRYQGYEGRCAVQDLRALPEIALKVGQI